MLEFVQLAFPLHFFRSRNAIRNSWKYNEKSEWVSERETSWKLLLTPLKNETQFKRGTFGWRAILSHNKPMVKSTFEWKNSIGVAGQVCKKWPENQFFAETGIIKGVPWIFWHVARKIPAKCLRLSSAPQKKKRKKKKKRYAQTN